ncbi:hypothetical protein ATANTOWER_027546 [Ataeniobius toweri]|uniref:Uncharacterized protein n=1 Tax=Ataeniobius toweri TaxID=208326 RepID=A0ABU7BSD4_9TELE|nr:hypothetical protein [Ataeniobius toweri]
MVSVCTSLKPDVSHLISSIHKTWAPTCRWFVSLPAGLLVVLGVRGWVCAGSLPVAACQGLDPWALSGLCLGSDMFRVSGLWVHGWIYSGVDGCRRGLWARRCSSLELLQCGYSVVPMGLPLLFSGGLR